MAAPANAAQVQGQGSVSADNINTFQQWTTTAAQLRQFIGLSAMTVALQGVTAPNDGFGGDFYWVATATGPDDNFNIIVPTGVTVGAWVRLSFISGDSAGRGAVAGIKIANYSLATTDYFVPVDATSGPITISLPAAATAGLSGKIYSIMKIDATGNLVTIAPAGADTTFGINILALQNQDAKPIGDGVSRWYFQ